MKIKSNRTVIGGCCILLAALLAFGLIPKMNKSKGNTVKVVVTNADIAHGTQITDSIPVEADSEEEALDIVEDGWYNGKYVLDSGDFVDGDMYIQKVEE